MVVRSVCVVKCLCIFVPTGSSQTLSTVFSDLRWSGTGLTITVREMFEIFVIQNCMVRTLQNSVSKYSVFMCRSFDEIMVRHDVICKWGMTLSIIMNTHNSTQQSTPNCCTMCVLKLEPKLTTWAIDSLTKLSGTRNSTIWAAHKSKQNSFKLNYVNEHVFGHTPTLTTM